jgi:hypothetical protein
VQALPSLQVVPFAAAGFEQAPVDGLQVPAVWHWSCAVHVTGLPPVQTPAWQVSVCVQAFPSLHTVPLASFASDGQLAELPVQLSATSHWPLEGRQTVVDGRNESAGHAADEPLQVSARSQAPAAARQTVEANANPSAGQVELVPVQVSATSQAPADARQTAPAFPTGCWQATAVPLHWSWVHGLPSSVQAVPFDFLVSAGQAAEEPVQVSARSHSPAAARQTVVDEAKPSAGQVMDVPLQVSATSQDPADARHTVPLGSAVQVPSEPTRLQAPQVPVQAVLQQTPLTQKPDAHWLFDEHERPNEASYRYEAVW